MNNFSGACQNKEKTASTSISHNVKQRKQLFNIGSCSWLILTEFEFQRVQALEHHTLRISIHVILCFFLTVVVVTFHWVILRFFWVIMLIIGTSFAIGIQSSTVPGTDTDGGIAIATPVFCQCRAASEAAHNSAGLVNRGCCNCRR